MITSEHPTFDFPPGRVPGCLPRTYLPGDVCPSIGEHIKIIPSSEWSKHVGKVSLRPYVKTVLDQNGVGSCATEAAAQAVMIARAVAGLPHVELNPWFIYHHTSGGRDGGSSIDENLEFVRSKGIAPMSVWPRSKGWRAKPSAEAYEAAKEFTIEEFYDVATINEMVSCLLSGFPVVWGSNGHAVCKVEHLSDREGLDINSWGSDWGDGGFGVWATYRSINWNYGAWAVRVA
jgi:hypothetical protein